MAAVEGGIAQDVVDQEELEFSDDDGAMLEMLNTEGEEVALSGAQKARAHKNKMKAVALKAARLQARPYQKEGGEGWKRDKEKKLVDGGGGFFIEEEEGDKEAAPVKVAPSAPAPLMPPDQPECEECGERFPDSYLFRTFDCDICDNCKNSEKDGPHELITKTDSKKEFLLKDSDFEKGERDVPLVPLRFILRKNPHNPRWGDMKLFLRLQVEARALQVWGSEEALEEEHTAREERLVAAKSKKYEKKMKELRKAVRSSLFTKDLSAHVHSYGEESYHEDRDEYSKECGSCGHVQTFEKM